MQLELRQTDGPGSGGGSRRWRLDHGRRTMGGAPDCDWPLEGVDRTLSDYECSIARDRDGFVLTDRSASGTRVGEAIVRQGETARLLDGSVITFGPFRFVARVVGEPEPELGDSDGRFGLSDEAPTISAILSDVVPGRRGASGLGGAFDVVDPIGAGNPLQRTERGIADARPSSRHVEIGWDGPPTTGGSPRPLLPDDWNEEVVGGHFSNDLEHRAALSTVLPSLRSGIAVVAPSQAIDPALPSTEDPCRLDDAWFEVLDRAEAFRDVGASETDAERIDRPANETGHIRAPDAPLDRTSVEDVDIEPARPASTVGDQPSADFGDLRAPLDGAEPPRVDEADEALADEGAPERGSRRTETLLRDCEDVLDEIAALVGLPESSATSTASALSEERRLQSLLARQLSLRDALDVWVREIGRRLDPRVIEARVDETRSLLPRRQGRYWTAYRQQFRSSGRDLSVAEFLQGLTRGPQQTQSRK